MFSLDIHSANAARAATTANDDSRFEALESRNIALTAELQSLTIARGWRGSMASEGQAMVDVLVVPLDTCLHVSDVEAHLIV